MIPISIPHLFEFNELSFQDRTPDNWKNIVSEKYRIDLESPVRLKNIRIKLKPFNHQSQVVFRINFISISHGEQNESFFFDTAFEKIHKPEESRFWQGHPFYVKTILFYPENLNDSFDFRFKATVYKIA